MAPVWNATAEVVPLGIANAIATLPMVVAIVLATGPRGTARNLVYALGWAAATVLIGVGVLLLADPHRVADRSSTPGLAVNLAKLATGLAFLALAAWNWRRERARRRAGLPPGLPRWMRAIDRLPPWKALLLGMALAMRPKNLALDTAAALSVAQTGVPFRGGVLAYLAFVALSTLGVAAPLGVAARLGDRSSAALARWKEWLVAHQALIMVAIYLLFGSYLMVRAMVQLV